MPSTNEGKHQSSNPFLRFALNRFFAALIAIMPRVDTVLDVGCGEGYAAQRILQDYPHLRWFGADISHAALRRATAILDGKVPLCVADAKNPPYLRQSADLLISLEVLEHIPDPQAVVAAYKSITRCYMLLSVPNEPVFRLQRMARGLDVDQWGNHPEHVNHWSTAGFVRFLKAQELDVLEVVSPFPYSWSIVLCQLRKLGQ